MLILVIKFVLHKFPNCGTMVSKQAHMDIHIVNAQTFSTYVHWDV